MYRKVCISFIAVLLLFLLSACSSTQLDMREGTDISVSGLNGSGELSIHLSESSLSQMLAAERDSFEEWAAFLSFLGSVDYAVSQDNELSNGDEVGVEITYDKEGAKKLKLAFTNTSFTYVVQGLTVPEPFDAFADISIEFTGISPLANATVINDSQDPFGREIKYSLDMSSGLANGDTVTITASASEAMERQHARYIETESKTFTVEGLDHYISSADDLTNDVLTALCTEAEDRLAALFADTDAFSEYGSLNRFANDYGDLGGNVYEYDAAKNAAVDAPEHVSTALLTRKNADMWNSDTYKMVFTYRVPLTGMEQYGLTEIFIPMSFGDSVISANGDLSIGEENYWINFHPNDDSAYAAGVTSLRDTYFVEDIE